MKILFQGDSITDAGRDRTNYHDLGSGYPKYAAEFIANRHPGTDFEFINLGISGHRAEDLRARWQADCIDHQPDLVSILIGVNDTCKKAWISPEYFEECYRDILTQIKEKTNAKILILEQFLIPTAENSSFRPNLDPKIQVTRALAREFADAFIPLDGIIASHCLDEVPSIWAGDGIHPSAAGAQLIAQYYADAFDKIYPILKK